MINRTTGVVSAVLFAMILYVGCSGEEKKPETTSAAPETAAAAAEASDPMKDKGVGPVSSVSLGDIDDKMAEDGKSVFEAKCTSCHKIEAKHVGPALAGVTTRRAPEWIMNMMLNPGDITQQDPIAKELLATYIAPMANQSLTQEEARKVLEYFRSIDKK